MSISENEILDILLQPDLSPKTHQDNFLELTDEQKAAELGHVNCTAVPASPPTRQRSGSLDEAMHSIVSWLLGLGQSRMIK